MSKTLPVSYRHRNPGESVLSRLNLDMCTVFSAASESFSKMNMNKSIEVGSNHRMKIAHSAHDCLQESLNGYLPVCEQAKSMGIPIRG